MGRELLVELTSKRAVHLSTAPLHLTHCLIATGHQPWLWHPGILAKDIAASVVARRFGGQPIHLVVDQDGLNDVTIELPVVEGQCLSVQRIVLAPCQSMVPLCCQPPADFRAIRRVLARIAKRRKGRVAVNVQPLIDAFRRLPACRNGLQC